MKTRIALIVAIFLLSASLSNVVAQYGQYQTPPSFNIVIDKMVARPDTITKGGTVTYVDNLTTLDTRYAPSQDVWFRLSVKNTSNSTLTSVVVKDFLPGEVDYVEGASSFDGTSNTFIINAGDFAVNEEKVYFIKARVKSQDKLPAEKGLWCVVNRSEARNDKAFDEDSAQFCIEKQVLGGATEVPAAGPAGFGLFYGLTSLIGLVGLRLRKTS